MRLAVGKILKPIGLKGEVKVLLNDKNNSSVLGCDEIIVSGTLYRIIRSRMSGGFGYLILDGIDSIERADNLRGQIIEIDKAQAKSLDEGEFFVADLIGCTVLSGDDRLGVLVEVLQHGAADVFVVEDELGGRIMFPHLSRVVIDIDISDKTIKVDGKELAMVVVR